MPRPANPLSAAFDEIEAQAQQFSLPLGRGEGPPNAVGREEIRVMTGLRPMSADLARAEDLATLGGKANAGGPIGGQWGTQVTIHDQALHNQPVAVINVKGDDAAAEVLTVALEQPVILDTAPAAGSKVTAVVEYGQGGSAQVAEIDWAQGTTFQVHASWLRVSARIDPEGAPGTGNKFLVSGFASRRECPRQSELLKSFDVGGIGHGAASTILIANKGHTSAPGANFAKATKFRFLWTEGATPVTAVAVLVQDSAGAVLYQVDLSNDPDQWIPIFGRAYQLTFQNNDGANAIVDSFVVFNIEL